MPKAYQEAKLVADDRVIDSQGGSEIRSDGLAQFRGSRLSKGHGPQLAEDVESSSGRPNCIERSKPLVGTVPLNDIADVEPNRRLALA